MAIAETVAAAASGKKDHSCKLDSNKAPLMSPLGKESNAYHYYKEQNRVIIRTLSDLFGDITCDIRWRPTTPPNICL
jgi:hypothetical protein